MGVTIEDTVFILLVWPGKNLTFYKGRNYTEIPGKIK